MNLPVNAGDIRDIHGFVRSLGREDPLEKGMATHSNILAWKIPRAGAWCTTGHGVEKVRHDWTHTTTTSTKNHPHLSWDTYKIDHKRSEKVGNGPNPGKSPPFPDLTRILTTLISTWNYWALKIQDPHTLGQLSLTDMVCHQ